MNNPQALVENGRALHFQGRLQEAEAMYRRALALAPGHPVILAHLGMLAMDTGRASEAASLFQAVVRAQPSVDIAWFGLGNALNILGRSEEALAAFETLLRHDSRNAGGHFGAGHALESLGRLDEARRAFEQAVALAPDMPAYHYPLAAIARFDDPADPRLAALEALAKNAARYPENALADVHFGLGKAYGDLGRYAESFAHYAKGNAIRRRFIPYDERHEMDVMAALASSFTPDVLARPPAGDLAHEPVFVVGMPRSGTSLIEQILASHPDVYGGGELNTLAELLDVGLAGRDFPFGIAAVPNEALRRFGADYVAAVRRLKPSAKRIVDKQPSNFRLVGLIRLVLPKARIVHIRRDPRDTCLSCYFNMFAQSAGFSYDLRELGRFYKAYERLMAHWRAVLPQGAMLEMDYETLVEQPEAEIRRLLKYCGLDFDSRCLEFHRTKRVVHTRSAAQVRQPMNRSGLGRFKPYEEFLGPLLTELAAD